ncbi:MAG: biotin--[acetyl-CoA-carboxylase] ligase [Saprospiraceae bacterium]|nr:biotin--[acetyl-CoA-carboxylase] ligase [Saprospiraceae bacterium]
MSTNLIGSSHQHFEILDSTNLAAVQLIAKARPKEGLVISADAQTAGVGQIGSKWQSEYAKNCLFSIILYPTFLKAEHGFYLQMAVCNAMKTSISRLFPTLDLKIKWPNDLFGEGKKLAGLLIQTAVRGYYMDYAVIGIGINVNQVDFPLDIGSPTSLHLLLNQSVPRSQVMSEILHCLDEEYERLQKHYPDPSTLSSILNEFENNLYLHNIWALYLDVDGLNLELYMEGVKSDGRLILRDRKGEELLYNFKEIKLLHPI